MLTNYSAYLFRIGKFGAALMGVNNRQYLPYCLVKVLIDNNIVESVAAKGPHFPPGVLEPHAQLLGRLGAALSQTLFQGADRRRQNKHGYGFRIGPPQRPRTLHVDVKEHDTAAPSDGFYRSPWGAVTVQVDAEALREKPSLFKAEEFLLANEEVFAAVAFAATRTARGVRY
ncbi:MAG TPA: hypothetical protein VMY05_08780 [Acidobacteriota bacterium]|nr:hypothetical protein [Acidobacteriota bacterium]